jgi:hypothetical protein
MSLSKGIPSNVEKVMDKDEKKLKLVEERQDVLHKAIIKIVKLEKNMPRPIKPQAHLALGLWYVLEGGMWLVNWEWKSKNPFEFVNIFQHFVATDTFIASFQVTIGHW